MITIVNTVTGKVEYCSLIPIEADGNQAIIEGFPNPELDNPYWDFANNEFFNKLAE